MKTNQINKIITPRNILSQFNLSKTIRIDVATGPDTCMIMFLDRRFNYHIIEYSAPKKERDIHTERKEASFVLANGIDKIKITRVITTDQYLVWDELEKALSVTEYPPIHDIDGFQVMIPKGNIKRTIDFKTKKEMVKFQRFNNYDHLADVRIGVQHTDKSSEEMEDFSDAVILQCAIYAQRIEVRHDKSYRWNDDRIQLSSLNFAATIMTDLEIDEDLASRIIQTYAGILSYPDNIMRYNRDIDNSHDYYAFDEEF